MEVVFGAIFRLEVNLWERACSRKRCVSRYQCCL